MNANEGVGLGSLSAMASPRPAPRPSPLATARGPISRTGGRASKSPGPWLTGMVGVDRAGLLTRIIHGGLADVA